MLWRTEESSYIEQVFEHRRRQDQLDALAELYSMACEPTYDTSTEHVAPPNPKSFKLPTNSR